MKYVYFLIIIFSLSVTIANAKEEKQKSALRNAWENFKVQALKQKEVPVKKVEAPAKKVEAGTVPSKGKMLSVIKRRLESFGEIIDMVPGLSKKIEAEKIEYYYTPREGVTINLEDLDIKTLQQLYSTINQHATRLNTERIMAQLRLIEQAGKAAGPIPRVPVTPVQPPALPQIQLPPQPPQPPPQPPQRPSLPPARPPETPRR